MRLLINRTDIAKYRQISNSVFDDVLNSKILEAQMLDVAPLLGEKLFNSLMFDPVAQHAALLNEGSYEHEGSTFYNYGLKAVIAHYTYARYQMFGGVIDTPFSQIEKLEGNESRPTSDKTKRDLYTINQQTAFSYWQSVEQFLIRTDYDLYDTGGCGSINPPGRTGFNISKIS